MPHTRATLSALAAASRMREASTMTDPTVDTDGGAQKR